MERLTDEQLLRLFGAVEGMAAEQEIAYDTLRAVVELKELREAQKQGRPVELPFKIGNTVYWPNPYTSGVNYGCVTAVRISRLGFDLELLVGGRFAKRPAESVFLTREEAEAAREAKGDI